MSEVQEPKELTKYQKYVKKMKQQMHNPKPPKQGEYVRLTEKGRAEYMKYVKKAYEMMFFWIGFGGLMGYLTYSLAPHIKILRNRPSFKQLRLTLAVLPIFIFSYHGIKFMSFYKRKGSRQVSNDSSNMMTDQQYQQFLREQSKVNSKTSSLV